MLQPTLAALRYLRTHSWTEIWRTLAQRDSHPLLQFLKYGFCGVAATVVHNGVLALLSITLLPAVQGMLVDGQVLSESVRNRHLLINNCIAFPFGLLTAYFLNIAFVFTPGRHRPAIEFLLFSLVGALGFFPGLVVVNWLAGHLHLPSAVAQAGFILTSVIVNFLCRKFVIFKH